MEEEKKGINKYLIILGIIAILLIGVIIAFLLIKGNPKEYIVTFDSNGGSSIEAVIVKENEKVTKPKDPTRDGYKFNGWYLNDKAYDFDTKVTDNITLKAQWNQEEIREIVLEISSLELKVGEKSTIHVVSLPDGYTINDITYVTSDSSIANVDANGVVTAIEVGSATITVSTKDNANKALVSVIVSEAEPEDPETPEVTPEVESVSISGSSSVYVGNTLKLSAILSPKNSKSTLTWKSSDTNIATIDKNGKVTAKKAGKVTITVTTANGKTATKAITVNEKPAPTSVTISGPTTVNSGSTITLKATVKPSNASSLAVTWTSSDPNTATVDKNGKVKGIKSGTVTVTAKTVNGKTATHRVTVKDVWTVKLVAKNMGLDTVLQYTYTVYKNGSATTDYQGFKLGDAIVTPGGGTISKKELTTKPSTTVITLNDNSTVTATVTYN